MASDQLLMGMLSADRCLQDALRRCRKANIVDSEPDLLLALVRLEWAGVHGYPIAEKIKRLPALDVSEFTDLYQSPDPDFYKGIPEYEMLKRGLTDEERIRNGYFPVYQMAEALEAAL